MRVRLFGFLIFAFAALPGYANGPIGHGYIRVQNPAVLLEHLVNHADKLVTNLNLTRTNGFRIEKVLIEAIVAGPCWSNSFYTDVLATSVAVQKGGADGVGFMIRQLAKNFSIKVIELNDIALGLGPSQALADKWEQTNFAYFNAISAANFYLDALIRGQRLAQWPFYVNNPALLQRRIDLLRANIMAIQDVMYQIRYAAAFRFPLLTNCIECSFNPGRQIGRNPMPQFVFPYYANNRVVFPDNQQVPPMQAPAQFQTNYQVEQWSNRWNVIDQGYLNPGANRTYGGQQAGIGGGNGAPMTSGGFSPGQGGRPGQGQGYGQGGQPSQGQGYGQGGQPSQGQGYGQGGQPSQGQPGQGGQPGLGQGGQTLPAQQPGQTLPAQQPGQGQTGQPVPQISGGGGYPTGGAVTPTIPAAKEPVPENGYKPGTYDYGNN